MSGSVSFREAAGNKGTEVRIEIHPKPPGGKLGATVASALSKLPEQQIKRDVQRLKARLEAGETPTTEGQSHGPRNPFPSPDGTSA
jgi:uncharacterized membrane protein